MILLKDVCEIRSTTVIDWHLFCSSENSDRKNCTNYRYYWYYLFDSIFIRWVFRWYQKVQSFVIFGIMILFNKKIQFKCSVIMNSKCWSTFDTLIHWL